MRQFKAKYYCELCKKQMQDKNGMVVGYYQPVSPAI